jgi:hypothetical protein
MKATELRIGNLVNYCNSERVLDAELFLQLLKYTTPFEPIPLTEEWLLKFGFEKIKDFNVYTNVWELKGFMVSLGEYINIHVDWADDGADNYHSIVVYEELYVHTLQNLYFALTSEELTIKQEEKSKETETYPCPQCQGGGCPYCSGYGTIPK